MLPALSVRGASLLQAALRAALEGLQMTGGQECDAPAGRLAVPLMRHQRLALAWMLQREREGSNPRGGLLADDQVCPQLHVEAADCK